VEKQEENNKRSKKIGTIEKKANRRLKENRNQSSTYLLLLLEVIKLIEVRHFINSSDR
jgi:hypothetical protein